MGPEPLGARNVRGGLVRDAFGAEFEEPGVGVVHERDVQSVDPRHRLVGVVVVAVEVPARRQQEVPAAHRHRIPVDDRPDAFALDDETEGVLRVAVLRGCFVRAQILDRRPQRRRRIRRAGQARVGQRDGPAFPATAHRHQVTGTGRQWVQIVPAPHVRHGLRGRNHRHQVRDLGPERNQVPGLEILIQLLQLGGFLGGRLRNRVRCANGMISGN